MSRRVQVLSLALVALLLTDPALGWGKKSSSSKTSSSSSSSTRAKTSSSSSSSSSSFNKPSSTSPKTKTQPSYPRQPTGGGTSYGGQPNPYPKGGSYPGVGTNTNQQTPGRGGTSYGGNTNQQYPGRGGTPNQQYPGYPNQPGAGSYPNQQYPGYPNQPGAGSYPNQQYPGRGGTPNQQYPGYPNQPGAGSYPNQQYPGRGGTNYGGYPNQQYPGAGGYPNQQYPGRGGTNHGGYPNQPYPGAGGRYPAGGGYGWGQGGGYGYGGGGYSNWNPNPNNKILSPRYGGGFGYGGGSPFSHAVKNNGFQPSVKSKSFVKKAMLAAGVGAVAGMAVGYGLGRFPQPHFSFRSPSEEMYYNRYMYTRYGQRSTDDNDYREYVYKPPPKGDKNYQSYEQFMDSCMNRTDLLRPESGPQSDQPSPDTEGINVDANPSSTVGNADPEKSGAMATRAPEADLAAAVGIRRDKRSVGDGNDDTVSISEIGYPALIEQLKSRRCVELYMGYSERFLQKQSQVQDQDQNADQRQDPYSRGDTSGRPLALLLTTSVMVLCSNVLLH